MLLPHISLFRRDQSWHGKSAWVQQRKLLVLSAIIDVVMKCPRWQYQRRHSRHRRPMCPRAFHHHQHVKHICSPQWKSVVPLQASAQGLQNCTWVTQRYDTVTAQGDTRPGLIIKFCISPARTDNRFYAATLSLLSASSGSVEHVATFKLLGINLGASLSWSLHVNTILC